MQEARRVSFEVALSQDISSGEMTALRGAADFASADWALQGNSMGDKARASLTIERRHGNPVTRRLSDDAGDAKQKRGAGAAIFPIGDDIFMLAISAGEWR